MAGHSRQYSATARDRTPSTSAGVKRSVSRDRISTEDRKRPCQKVVRSPGARQRGSAWSISPSTISRSARTCSISSRATRERVKKPLSTTSEPDVANLTASEAQAHRS